ncbi:MAG: CBS domain-containing protein [Deltaproteobacteria bacterium]|nr:CBS domain-containing protein [Deltaproteobacteria bacterium]MBW2051576.1 CBS domain-containing protein [Deltaproteobacteria bacterium]MBW2139879.1 CBS domain-containing protein [Deltaproteobacteria bacterium]MBW2323208.1 CBS domain-containing protein [Deltaproteobacteria bacterium]
MVSSDEIILPEIKPLPDGAVEIITTHINADFDALASMLAVGKLYPQALMVFPGSQERNLRNFFLQSTAYLFNFVKLKEVKTELVRRLILVDTRQVSRIGPLEKILKNKDLKIHIYDHHPNSSDDLKGELEILAPIGATVTIMTEILKAKGMPITPEEATVMTLGIHEDTGSLTFGSTTPRDYLAAAYLLECGANLNLVSEMITRELTSEQVSILNELINSTRTQNINGVDVSLAQVTTDHYVSDFAVLVHKLMDMENINVIFALARMEDHVYLVARSRLSEINVADTVREFGGGGHPSAASASIKNQTLTQVEDKLQALIAANIGPIRRAQDIMAFPVISIPPDGTLAEARETLTRYDINVLVVVDKKGLVLGYISQQNVSKALHHGLTDMPVSEFMTSEFNTVDPMDSFPEIIQFIVDQNQRILPVVKDNRLVGVITRTDLLNILTSDTDTSAAIEGYGENPHPGRRKSIKNLMRERLPKNIISLLADLGRTADRLGYSIYAVGGFIRDVFIKQENLDIDVVVEGDGINFAKVFAAEHPGVRIRSHLKFNSAVLIFPDGFKVDVATARLEYYESPATLPIVEVGSLRLDLYRRDFTINTMAVKLNEERFGNLIDYFRGVQDIKYGYIRVLHNLSFVEDPTRVFRAIRFEQRFGFKISKLTANLIQNAVKHNFFEKLSPKRLFVELKYILQEDEPGRAMKRLDDFDLLKFIMPDLKFNKSKAELFERIRKVCYWFELTYLGENYQPWMIYFLGLTDGRPQEKLAQVSDRLIQHRRDRQLIIEEKPEIDRILRSLHRQKSDIQPGKLYELLHPLSTEAILYLMAKTTREDTRRAISSYFTKLKNVQIELTGKDLIAMGFEPGPRFKEILGAVHLARLNGELNSLEDEKKYVQEHILANS